MNEKDSSQALTGKIDSTLLGLDEVRAQCLHLEQSLNGVDSRIAGILKLDAVADADMQQRFTAQNARLDELEAKLIDTKSLAHEISANLRLANADAVKLRTDFDNTASAAQAQLNSLRGEIISQRTAVETMQANWSVKHTELERKILRQRLIILGFILIVIVYFGVLLSWGRFSV